MASVYFDHKIQAPTLATHELIACHNNYALLAVGSANEPEAGGSVTLYLDEGELLEESVVQRSSLAASLAWHPSRKILAIGWENGEILIWNEHDHELHEAAVYHKAVVKHVEWNSTGSRFISADRKGAINIWKADQRGRLQQAPMYKHEVNSPITQIAFETMAGTDIAADIAAAARAAVSGDEVALDMFTFTKTSSLPKFNMPSGDTIQLFFGTADGNVFYIDDQGRCSSKFTVDGSVKSLIYYEKRDVVLTITESLMLTQHRVKSDGETTEIVKVKLSGQPARSNVVWSGDGILATASGEQVIRVLDIDNDENYVLSLDNNTGFQHGESINCLAYSPQKGILAGGTNMGKVALWQQTQKQGSDNGRGQVNSERTWELLPPSNVDNNVVDLQWGAGKGFLAVNCESTVVILNESVMNAHFNQQVGAVQVSPSQLSVEVFSTNLFHDLKTDIHIKGVFVTKNHTTIWNGKKIVVYEVSPDKSLVRAAGDFSSDSVVVASYEQSLYLIEPGKISVRTFQGTVKQELPFSEQEGDPILLSINGFFLAAGTNKAFVKVFDLSRREARQHGSTKSLEELIPGFGQFRSVKCNCTGNKVSVICEKANRALDTKIYVWDGESDVFQYFDFLTGSGQNDGDENLTAAQEQLAADIKERVPKAVFWDSTEPKLFTCETVVDPSNRRSAKPISVGRNYQGRKEVKAEEKSDVLIVSLFSTPDSGIIVQDHFSMDTTHTGLMGLEIPYFYFSRKASDTEYTSGSKHLISQRTMRDFVGLENADLTAKDAMVKFSYLSAIGNMDEAFKAIKAIKSGTVWENMARMCVKTKRLDVATVCLGNMGNARGAKALREASKEPELDARVAMLALQLGMLDDAEKLYKQCKRYDLLNEFYQASNNWTKAIETAELHDRIHLRTTYYNYGKYLESVGNFAGAIQQYERSDTYRFEVPRMLFEEPTQLESYILKSKDRPLWKWWAQYMESVGEMETALQFYESAQDNLSLVRVYCYCGNLEKAAEICNETGDKAACYHLARQFENQDNIKSAIHYFSRAQAYSNAIRLAKDNELDNELMNLALLSSPEDMVEAARYFEGKPGLQDKAVMLYQKAGTASKAIDLAFRTQQFGALQLISEELDENTDPELLNKCAEFFIEHGQFDRAVNLLIVAQRYQEALEMCMDHHVTIDEDLAERMTLPKDHEDQDYRLQVLERIAECAFRQGSYHLATKKFTQAGNKAKAMKALLKSGDTEKIIFFASVSRQREIYVMAANYLQSMDWRKDPEIMKNIIVFYTKGRALDSLASFYEACAQVEMDEYQNYEKAYGALSEAYKFLSKAKSRNATQQEERLATLKQKMGLIKKFMQAKKIYDEDPEESLRQCQIIIDDPEAESAIRIGDVFGFMIEHNARAQDYNQAYNLMQELRQRIPSVNMAYYISMRTIESIHKALGIPLGRGMGGEFNKNGMINGDDIEDGEIVDEEVPDEAYDAQDDDYI